MAQKIDHVLPYNDLTRYIPRGLRNQVNVGLLDSLFNRFMTRDESVPMYGYVGRKPTSADDRSPALPQASVERDINAVSPVLSFKVGSETHAFTVQDLLNKARVLGVDTGDMAWLYSQGNNFRPPIDLDKFTNFFNYYWVALDTVDTPWNTEKLPEYYVIAPPQPTDLDKLNVVAATVPGENLVLTGSGFIDQQFILTFTSPTSFNVSTTAALLGPRGLYAPVASTFSLSAAPSVPQVVPVDIVDTFQFQVAGPAGTFTLVTFTITREPTFNSLNIHTGYTAMATGDAFTIDTTYLSPSYNVTFTGSAGIKPKVAGVQALSAYQKIDNYQIQKGDRVLIKNQSNGAENGIYVVSEQGWSRSSDFTTDTWSAGARVFVRHGAVNVNTMWTSSGVQPVFTWSVVAGVSTSNTSDWQEGNFWIRGDQLDALGVGRSTALQATRAIIEYDAAVQLNSFIDVNGLPGEGISNFKQEKTEFNQLPLFDLFRYDGTHAGVVSSVFYYVEDLTADLDLALQKRVKRSTNDSIDFIFNHGCSDEAGALLFFKKNGDLHTVFHAGYLSETVVDFVLDGTGDGSLAAVTAAPTTQQQIWTITATSPTTFEVVGSKVPQVPSFINTATVGVPYLNSDIGFTITAGPTPFVVGDMFTLRVGNLERPRYSFRAADGSIQDLYGGPSADVNEVGAYQVSRTFINNPYNVSRSEVLEGAVFTHFRSVLANQPTGLPTDYAFGGTIKLWSEQHTLLASLLMQRDLTPVSMIDMAKRQYETALNTLRDLYLTSVVDYFSTTEVVDSDGSPGQTAKVNALLDHLLSLRAQDNDVRTVLFDTTAVVTGFPATLPQLGLAELVTPTEMFDLVLGLNVLVHHDGHETAMVIDDLAFRDLLLGNLTSKTVTRSDGAVTPAFGSFTLTPPAVPYKGELWLRPTDSELADILAFDVLYDTPTTPPVGDAGTRWFNRDTVVLFESDGFTWVAQPSPLVAWTVVSFADTLNELLLLTEKRLYNGINPDQRKYDYSTTLTDPAFQLELKQELFNFSALNNLDPLGTNYSASDAFTWNYSQALTVTFPPLSAPAVPARWYSALKAHQATVAGVVQTERPDLEPWKLFGYTSYAAWWGSLAPATQAAYTPAALPAQLSSGSYINAGSVKAVKTVSGVTPLLGLQTIDGVSLVTGDKVLLVSETSPANNGPWIVSTGAWTRTPTSLLVGTYLTVAEGDRYTGTQWVLTATVTTVNVDPVVFGQVREWSEVLWDDVAVARPTLRTSVDPWTGYLLPPYVNPALARSAFALTTAVPTGIALPFQFGEGSPVEEAWVRSIEYQYALAKALFRFDPLALLGFAWGFAWVEVDGILYDGMDLNMPGHRSFRLHGETVAQIDRTGALTFSSVTGANDVDLTITYDAYDANRRQSFSVRDTFTGTLLGTLQEGLTVNFVSTPAGWNIQLNSARIEDFGRPFHMGDQFRVTATATGANAAQSFIPTASNRIYGLGQTFTNALREVSVDASSSYANNAFRDWDVNMGYRAGSLVATDDLVVYTDSDTLSSSSYTLLLKKNEIAADKWIQALRVTVLQYGEKGVVPPSKTGPQYRGTEGNFPAGDGSDWVFRVEGYNPRFTSLTYNVLQTIPSGMSFPSGAVVGDRFFHHDTGEYYEFNGSSWIIIRSKDLITFNALEQEATKLTFFQSTVRTGTVETFLPLTITGVQALCDFMFGYADYCYEQGWRFSTDNEFNIDAQTGRHRSFQLEIEKFIDTLYRGMELDQGAVINPFLDRVWVQQDQGILSEFVDTALFDITGTPGVFDVLGVRYKTVDLHPLRGNLQSSIAATGPMFSVHAQLDEYEHLFVFNNFVDTSTQNGLLYDPFSGSRTVTYKFNGRKAASTTFRPEFGGHYIANGLVRQNLQASTDTLEQAYDPNHVFENTTVSKHALALLGFNAKSYFSNLDISDKTQFNFWRGLVHSKGTNLSVEAYLNNDRFQAANVDEYWAYKIAEYGDSRQLVYPELRLGVVDALQQFTQLQFDAQVGTELTNFTQISRLDESRWFSIEDLDQDAYFKAEPVGTFTKTVAPGELITFPFIADKLVVIGPSVVQVNATTLLVGGSGGSINIVGYGPATPRYNPIKLFNYVDNELVEEVPHWHPAVGQHSPTALESINIIGPIDQARYNYSTLVQGNNSYDPLRPWGDKEVGRVWLDTRNLVYVPYYDPLIFPNRAERLSRWGALADYATIDVYEWVKSTVPPADYAARAAVEALDADIAPANKASGVVALAETYSRDRVWFIRPVAWSQTGTVFGGHPSFNGSFNAVLYMSSNNDRASLELGTFEERGITTNMRIGAWDPDTSNPKAVSEAVVSSFTKDLLLSGLPFPSSGVAVSAGTVNMAVTSHTAQTGALVFAPVVSGPNYAVPVTVLDPDGNVSGYNWAIQFQVTDVDTGEQQVITVDTLFQRNTAVLPAVDAPALPSISLTAGSTFTFTLTSGYSVSFTVGSTGTFPGHTVATSITSALGSLVSARDAAVLVPVADNRFTSGMLTPDVLDNDPLTSTNINNQGIGWVAWEVPTQAELSADGQQPNSIWKPFAGDYAQFSPSQAQLADAIAFEAAPLKLNDGTEVHCYTTGWSDWTVLKDIDLADAAHEDQSVATATGPLTYTHTENLDALRTTVYVNGIAQLKAQYSISGPSLTITNVLIGSRVNVLVRKYSPSTTELSFNPDVADDLSFQRQYKVDYEYVANQSRDTDGSPSTTYYYFWVKNRSVVAQGKKLSVQSIAQELRDGPTSYLTFQTLDTGMIGTGTVSDPYRYDAITISGLSYLVTKDNAFKLRFTRNFTLRADPEDVYGSELKNVHTEWGLIRASQKTKVPETLWDKLVDSMAGEDGAGNAVPSLRRVLYDERTGSATQFGFGPEQTLAPSNLLIESVKFTILNTTLVDTSGSSPVTDFISVIDFNESDSWFDTPAHVRSTMSAIWNGAKSAQVNEIFFAALEDILASNLQLTDIFKTSRLSVYSIRTTVDTVSVPNYE